MSDPVRAVYDLQLHRVRLRALAARHRRDGNEPAATSTLRDVDETARSIDHLRAGARDDLRDARLASQLRLSPLELDLLWSVVAASADPTLSPLLRDLAGGEARHGLSLALHAVLAGANPMASCELAPCLTPLHPLLRFGLLEPGGDGVAAARPFAAPARVIAHLAGRDELDAAVVAAGGIVGLPREPELDDAHLDVLRSIARALATDEPLLIVLEGPPGVGKRTAAAIAASARQRAVLQLDAARLARAAELERALLALRRECLLTGALPLIAHADALHPGDSGAPARAPDLGRLLDDLPVPTFATSTALGVELGAARRSLRIRVPAPAPAVRRSLWRRAVGDDTGADLDMLAARYRLGAGAIARAAAAARILAGTAAPATRHLVDGVRNGLVEQLGALATRVDVLQSWDDVVLNPDTMDQVLALVARVRHGHVVHDAWGFGARQPRGIGTAALFSGPPGTGKTMVAGLIARDLDLDLYQVDLSKVVSKWVGETEKQLARIFDAAGAGHALLLFDEADSLFAKRTEVKSAIDRYANLEVNYLLQRIESFGGVTILTTNLDTTIDPALRRRLAAHITFDAPELQERATLWARLLVPGAPTRGRLDFESLAERFPDLTGANIRNAVLAAAFLAAAEGTAISQQHLERGARGEYRAMGRVLR